MAQGVIMAKEDERLIDRDPNSEETEQKEPPFYKSETFILVLKISLALGVISSLLTGMILTNMRLGKLEEQITESLFQIQQFSMQQEVLVTNLKELTKSHQQLEQQVGTLDLAAAKGELSTALKILDTQSQNIDKQLAVTRNGLVSLSRMVKGSRVWQEDYSGQYKSLFDDNKKLKEEIKSLRGIQEEEEAEPRYLEMDF